ncbi:Hsp70 nucleotide exchange factor FES1 [Fusarium oxysporum f. sp. albedinis]|nr:Hsp70 nucleotide exchange factor FES1 [Fusarium oxysporum f. sp. albedinis]
MSQYTNAYVKRRRGASHRAPRQGRCQIIELPADHLEVVSFRDRVKRIKDENKFVNDENDTLHDSNNEKSLSYRSAESEDLYSSRHQTGVTSGALAIPPKEPRWL